MARLSHRSQVLLKDYADASLPYGPHMRTERYDVIVIGGGQAGLATGYQLRLGGARP